MREPTPSQTVGPFFSFGLCVRPAFELVDPEQGSAIEVRGRVLDGADAPLVDALVEIWQADESGSHRPDFGWGRSGTDGDGCYRFVTIEPGAVDGQAPHLAMIVFARGLLKPVRTRMYFPNQAEANARDPLLARLEPTDRELLVAAREPGAGLRFDIRLQGERQTPFFTL